MSVQQQRARPPTVRYGAAILAAAAATAVCFFFDTRFDGRITFLALSAAVLFALWYGGSGPALAATLASSLAFIYFLSEPRCSFILPRKYEQIGLFLYVATCLRKLFKINWTFFA